MTARVYRSPVSLRKGRLRAGVIALGLLLPLPVGAQNASDSVVVFGRVVEAVSRLPIARALVISADSATAVLSDSLGNFWIPLNGTPPYVVLAEQFGYQPTTFELPESAPSHLSILVLEPAPIQLEGITGTVVAETAIADYSQALARRRGGHSGSLSVYAADRLAREPGTALDLILQRSPIHECIANPFILCRRSRGQEVHVSICVDEVSSYFPVHELGNIPLEDVALVEFYGPTIAAGTSAAPPIFGGGGQPVFQGGVRRGFRGGASGESGRSPPQVRVYTLPGILHNVAGGARQPWPLIWGCF